METLNILENAKINEIDCCTAESVHLIAESMKLAWADRLAYDSDPRPNAAEMFPQGSETTSIEVAIHIVICLQLA